MNLIIMKNGKSKLLESLIFGDTLIIVVKPNEFSPTIPEDAILCVSEEHSIMGVWEGFGSRAKEAIKSFDRVIFYSNGTYNIFSNRQGVVEFNKLLGEDKVIYMFSSLDIKFR